MATTTNVRAIQPRRWTVDEFECMIQLRIFAPDEKLELLNGEITQKMTQNPPHATGLMLMQTVLIRIFGQPFMVRVQLPLSLDENDRPEPDLAIVTGAPRDYLVSHPSTALLVAEISDSTLQTDRDIKAAIYARAEIAEYWILNLSERTLEVHREPRNGRYNHIRILDEAQTLAPLAAPETSIAIAELLP